MKTKSLLSVIGTALTILSAFSTSVFAQANTVPAGYFTLTVAAGSGTSHATSNISFPLQGTASASGQMVGIITGVTSNTISNSNAGWTAGQLSVASTPYLIQITSGTAAGRTFLISTGTANTATALTIDPTDASLTDLTTLGIVTGTDTYQIIPADTISSIFGTPGTTGVQGGTSVNNADTVQVYNGTVWTSYFYNTNTSTWTQSAPPINANNIVIRPDTGVLYGRIANTPLTLTIMGRVPTVSRQSLVSNSSITFLSNYWPTPVTLLNSNIQNLPGWVAGTFGTADTIQVYNSSNVWVQYYYNGTHWMQAAPPIVSDNITIPAGSTVVLQKKTNSSGQAVLTQSIPYSL